MRVVGVVVYQTLPLAIAFRDNAGTHYLVDAADFAQSGATLVLNGYYVAEVHPTGGGRARLARVEPMVYHNGVWMIS